MAPGRVVVVGAGPAGASLALQLSRAGISTTLVEAQADFERQFRGEALMPSGLEALRAMGLEPLLQQIPQRALAGWTVMVNGRELFSRPEPPAGDSGPPCTLVSQPALLRALVQAASQHAPFRFLAGQSVVAPLLQAGGRWRGVVLRSGERLPADLVVACDGRGSLLRSRAGLELELEPQPIDLLWLRLRGPSPPPLQDNFLTVLGEQGLFSAFTSVSGDLQLGWVIGAGAPSPSFDRQGWIGRLAGQSPPPLADWLRQSAGSLQEPVRLSVRCGLARRWWHPGLLLLGDAAHPMSPVRAQGINMALRDSWAAAAVLTPLLQTGADSEQLDRALARLEARRRPEVETLQALQRHESARGDSLRRLGWARAALAAAAPWLGSPIGRSWQARQQPLRRGLTPAAIMMAG